MAEKSSFFTSLNGDRKYKSSDFAEYFSTFIGNGVFPNPSTNLLVTSNGDMTINLSPGFAWINGYMYHNTDNLTLTVEHADSALKRIDRVVLKCDFINREIKAYVKKGSFASSPIAPTLERGVNAYELALSDILVENGVISIQQSKITDTRLDENVCGIVTQTVKEIETSELYEAIDRASLMAKDQVSNVIKLRSYPEEQKLVIIASSPEIGEIEEEVDVNHIQGGAIEIACSSVYLLEALKAFESDEIVMGYNGTMRPLVMFDAEDDKMLQLIVPVRVE